MKNEDFRLENDDFRLENDDFRLKNDDFRLKNDDFRLKNDDFRLKNVGFLCQNSNAQLKIHLGLVVPPCDRGEDGGEDGSRGEDGGEDGGSGEDGGEDDGRGEDEKCPATFTIAGQERRWALGAALLFDDSYEHEVRNGCSESRGVLQLVITHPALL